MKRDILEILRCPHCSSSLTLLPIRENEIEVREGRLTCSGRVQHCFQIEHGIIRFGSGFGNALVQKEIAYENSTYSGSERLHDESLIAQFPETLSQLWPHTRHFGRDFNALIDQLAIASGDWVLDIGTGPCWSSRLLSQRGARVIAMDINDANHYGLRTADLLFHEHGIYFERILESMTNLPFQDECIHHITFNASFHHTPDHLQTLRECFRVLKPGGKAAMVNEDFASLRHSLCPDHYCLDTGSHHSIPYGEFEHDAARTGFAIRYFVAAHVRDLLQEKLSAQLGGVAARVMEFFPITIKQLKSALIVLEKPAGTNGVHGDVRRWRNGLVRSIPHVQPSDGR
jgi:ubiquinone/menaquinone biosynthesis C-methylase UbiE/uncharacterized protein YbaR (Trm112 family)